MGNLSKIILFIFAVQFCSAQQIKQKHPSVIVVEKDTLVCFTTEQSRQMGVWNEERKECVELRGNDNQKISELKKITTTQSGIIYNLENEIVQHKKNFKDKNSLLLICEDEKNALKDEVRKHKIGKWIAIIGGVFLSTLCLTL
jgi:hypothetical protein